MKAFNCYACHKHNKVGGVTPELYPYFTAIQQVEQADEFRVPPSLTGVGAS